MWGKTPVWSLKLCMQMRWKHLHPQRTVLSETVTPQILQNVESWWIKMATAQIQLRNSAVTLRNRSIINHPEQRKSWFTLTYSSCCGETSLSFILLPPRRWSRQQRVVFQRSLLLHSETLKDPEGSSFCPRETLWECGEKPVFPQWHKKRQCLQKASLCLQLRVKSCPISSFHLLFFWSVFWHQFSHGP